MLKIMNQTAAPFAALPSTGANVGPKTSAKSCPNPSEPIVPVTDAGQIGQNQTVRAKGLTTGRGNPADTLGVHEDQLGAPRTRIRNMKRRVRSPARTPRLDIGEGICEPKQS